MKRDNNRKSDRQQDGKKRDFDKGPRKEGSSKPAYGKSGTDKPSYTSRPSRDKKDFFGKDDAGAKKRYSSDKPSYGSKTSSTGKKDFYDKDESRSRQQRSSSDKPSYGSKTSSTGKKDFFGKDEARPKPQRFSSDKPSGKPGFREDKDRKDYGNKTYGQGEGRKPRPELSKEEGDLTTVYRGRGKDQKPVFEKVAKTDLSQKSGKKKFKNPFANEPVEERPDYNFERLEKNHKGKTKDSDELRLNKYISNSGICSRREADLLIQKGEVRVNGEVITEMGHKVKKTDKVTFKGKLINPEKPVYILLNKPKDFITTTEDPMERKTVMHLISNACDERVFPVGRLDRNTTGLLLFTNDGELAAKLSHPSNQIKKIYQVTLDKPLTKNDEEAIMEGLTLEDGEVKVDDMQVLSKDRTILGLEIHLGRNRIVRRIFAHLGYDVIALDRVMYAGLDKKDLPRGRWRFLAEKEVIRLKYFL